ncbi:MAG: translocation/assembly module TamB domain-containing protein [Elainellaceae cyanobacterium]
MVPPSPKTNHHRESTTRQQWLVRGSAAIAVTTMVGAVGVWGVQRWVNTRLVPRIERSITTVIGRPLVLGEVQRVSPISIRFGPTQIPATATDFDQVDARAVRVNFNPLEALLWRSLHFTVTLIEPQAVIDQTSEGWITTEIISQAPGWIELTLETIRVESGRVVLIPNPGSPDALERQQARVASRLDSGTLTPQPDGAWIVLDASGWGRLADKKLEFEIVGNPASGEPAAAMVKDRSQGTITVDGEADLTRDRRANVVLQTENLDLALLRSLLPTDLPIDLASGRLNSNLQIRLRENPAEEPIALNGTARLDNVGFDYAPLTEPVTAGQARLRFEEQRISVEAASARVDDLPLTLAGTVHLRNGYNLTAEAAGIALPQLLSVADVDSPVPVDGQLDMVVQITGDIAAPLLSGTVQADDLLVDRLNLGTARARWSTDVPLTATGAAQTFTLSAVEVFPSAGGALFGNGRLQLQQQPILDLALQANDLPGNALLQPYWPEAPSALDLDLIDANIQISGALNQLTGRASWQASGQFPAQGTLTWQGSQLFVRDTRVEIGTGEATVDGDIDLQQQQWRATVQGERLALAQLPLPAGTLERLGQLSQSPMGIATGAPGRASEPFDSILNGEVTIAGTFQSRAPSDITAEGLLRLSNAPLLEQPLRTQFSWSGQQLTIQEAIAPDLRVAGQLDLPFEGWRPTLQGFDLDVAYDNYDLARVAPFSKVLQLQGIASFDGRVAGTLDALSIDGQSQVVDLVINDIDFGTLAGPVNVSPSGSQITLSGTRSTIAATLDAQRQPLAFRVQQGETQVEGSRDGDRLTTAVRNFPLAALNLKPVGRLGALGGNFSGDLTADWRSLQLSPSPNWRTALRQVKAIGDIVVDAPRLGYIAGEQVRGQVQIADGVIRLKDGSLQLGQGRYSISGNLAVEPELMAQGTIVAEQGYVQDLLLALQIFDLKDLAQGLSPRQFGALSDIPPRTIGAADLSLMQRLQRYAEIRARQQQTTDDADAARIPPLAQLDGDFSGTIDVAFENRQLTAEFDLAGEDWRWGSYGDPNQLIVKGSLSEGTLTLLPLRFASGKTQLNFAGTLGDTDDALGQLRAENVPSEFLESFFNLPLDIDGDLNATATVSGSITNPQARGEINLANAALNNTAVEAATARFSYSDARLNLIGQMRLNEANPLRVVGSIPYRLPQATVEPADNRLSLKVELENDGLALLNVINNQVRWEGGEGSASLNIGGTLDQTPSGLKIQPLARGVATFDDAVFSAQVLPGELTEVTGEIQFISDRIQIDNLEGRFSNGQVRAQGTIPLATPDVSDDDTGMAPLKVDLTDLAINLKGLYNGNADGRIQVTGTALAPRLRGEIFLSDGRISLPEASPPGAAPPSETQTNAIFQPPELDELRVVLSDRLLITRAPLLNFVARGDVEVSGPLAEIQSLRPVGTIRLRSGQVNLLTSQFNLDRRYDNIARFLGSTDPVLDVRLETSVFEQTRQIPRPRAPFAVSEVAELPGQRLGALQTVQIQAAVQGPASQLFNSIELSSSPSRSDAEILALLGGIGGTGASSDAALALAGSALFTSIQTLISNTLGITNLRLFPAVITEDEREERGSDDIDPTLGLAAEFGVDLTDNLSISALQLLTVREPTQFGLRYTINDDLQLRGSTNFSDESRIVIEFGRRF